jgi:formylglycine-generating enzyme required for sulfatase activity
MKKDKVFLTLALAVILMFTACDNPSGGGGNGVPASPPEGMRLATPGTGNSVTITGDSAYYYNSSDYNKGVFIEGRTVSIRPFYIAEYETTYELWYTVYQWATDTNRGANRYTFANAGREGDDGIDGAAPTDTAKKEPVTVISWRDAIVWCNAYSEMSNKEPVYYTDTTYSTVVRTSTDEGGTDTAADKAVMKPNAKGCRLPTEAEWEYAARGGGTPSTTGTFANKWAGTTEENALGTYVWYYDNSYNLGSGYADYGTNPVGGKMGNRLGLYDMSGNVWEWCWDWYSDTVSTGTENDPTGPTSGSLRVFRGGSWDYGASYCAVARRERAYPGSWIVNLGFRLAACP